MSHKLGYCVGTEFTPTHTHTHKHTHTHDDDDKSSYHTVVPSESGVTEGAQHVPTHAYMLLSYFLSRHDDASLYSTPKLYVS